MKDRVKCARCGRWILPGELNEHWAKDHRDDAREGPTRYASVADDHGP